MGPGLFRLALAALVVVAHTTIYKFGTFAVETFFILSGYVITLVWERRYSAMTYAPFVFILSRLWRLYPAFAISIAFAAYLQNTPVSLKSFSLFGALSNTINPPVWSLDMEAQFYLMVSLIVPAIVGGVVAVYAVVAMVILFMLFFVPGGEHSFVTQLPFFMIGIIAARLKIQIGGRTAAASLLIGMALVGLSYLYEPTRGLFFYPYPMAFLHQMWGSAALAFVCAPFALWTAQRRSGGVDSLFGRLSYTLYLIHFAVLTALVGSDLITVWALSIFAAVALLAIEIPSEWLRERVVYRRNWFNGFAGRGRHPTMMRY